MNKSKFVYIGSLLILAVLLVLAFYHPIATESEYSKVQWVQMLETNGERIAEFNIVNHEGKDMNYTITSFINGKSCNSSVRIPSNGRHTYIRHIHMEELVEDKVTFEVYKEGFSAPIDELTYYLKKNEDV
jgi:hypothetical protein